MTISSRRVTVLSTLAFPHLSTVLANIRQSWVYSHLLRDVAGIFGLKVAYSGLNFVLGVILARLLGVTGFGAYSYALAWMSLLNTLAVLGLDTLLVREIAAYHAQSEWGRMRGLLRWTSGIVLCAAFSLALLAATLTRLLASRLDPLVLTTFWVALLLLPFLALMRLRQAAMQGLLHVVSGQVAEMLLFPLLLLGAVGGAHLLLEHGLTASWAMGMHCLVASITFLIGTVLLIRAIPRETREAVPVYQTAVWMQSALPMLFYTILQMVNGRLDMLLLGAIKGAGTVGIYSVAARWGEFFTFFLGTLLPALGPRIASLHATGDREGLQRVVTRCTRMTLLCSLPVAIGMLGGSRWLLLLYGPTFTQGQTALIILGIGQFYNVLAGPVGWLLLMTGNERDTVTSLVASVTVNAVLNLGLTPHMGLEGAAIASASSIITWNTLMAFFVYKRLGVHSTVLGRIRLKR
jgi:O-antigen/teichoic acid export membrane protein